MSLLFSDYHLPDQKQAILSADSNRSTLMVAATGLGKTVMMAGAAMHWPLGRIMMISHRFELNDQARKTFETICKEPVDFEQAGFMADQCSVSARCRIVVASVQSLNARRKGKRRFERFDPNEFGLIMVDEAHRAVAPSYQRVIDYFQDWNHDCCLLGVTATPDRLDDVGLGHTFETVACDYNIRWGIENGWLVPLKQTIVDVEGLDFSSIRSKKNEQGESDLDAKQLAEIVEAETVLHEMATPILDMTGDSKSAIIFCASVAHATRLAEVLNRHRPDSAISIDGSLPPMHPERKRLLAKFKAGEVQYFCNVGVATEGFDAPIASVIAIARPTKSRALYTQMVGRGTRSLPGVLDGLNDSTERLSAISRSGKPFARVIDFVGQSGRHNLVCTGDILAGENDPASIVEAAKIAAKNPNFDGDMIAAMEAAKKEHAKQDAARRAKLVARSKYKARDVDIWSPMEWVPPRTVAGFEGGSPPSEKQKAALQKFGLHQKEVDLLNRKQASTLLGKCFDRRKKGLCSLKQKRLLARYGVDANRMSFSDASIEIDKIAKNGWKR